jgi:protein FAM50
VKKGITIAQFIEKAKQEIKDLRGIGVDSLMFVKQNTIVPHVLFQFSSFNNINFVLQHFSFYELFLLNASSKTGTPLFTFDDRETEEVLC